MTTEEQAIILLKKLYFAEPRGEKNRNIFKEVAKFLTDTGYFPKIESPPEDKRYKQLDLEEEVNKIKNEKT